MKNPAERSSYCTCRFSCIPLSPETISPFEWRHLRRAILRWGAMLYYRPNDGKVLTTDKCESLDSFSATIHSNGILMELMVNALRT